MMIARLSLILAALCVAFVFAACEKKATPEQVASSFITAVTRMDIEAAYALVGKEAKAKTPMQTAVAERAKLAGTGLGVILEILADKTTHEITGTTIDGDSAMVSYKLISPDIKPIFQDPTYARLLRSQGNEIENLRKSFAARLNREDIQTQSQEKVISLIREDGNWLVKSFAL